MRRHDTDPCVPVAICLSIAITVVVAIYAITVAVRFVHENCTLIFIGACIIAALALVLCVCKWRSRPSRW